MATVAESPSLFQDRLHKYNSVMTTTVEHLNKVKQTEQANVEKMCRDLEVESEDIATEMALKEEELEVLEQQYLQIQKDNELKLSLARAALDKTKYKGGPGGGRKAASSVASNSLGLIAEVDEIDGIAEVDEEDEEADEEKELEGNTDAAAAAAAAAPAAPPSLEAPRHPQVEAINALADIVASEMAALRKQWQELSNGAANLSETASASRQQATRPSEAFTNDAARAGFALTPTSTAASTPTSAASRGQGGRMTVEQRIDRLQRDIRTETDRILQERGGGRPHRGTVGTPIATPMGTSGGSTPVPSWGGPTASSGSLMAAVGSGAGSAGNRSGRESPSPPQKTPHSSGLQTPVQSTSSRTSHSVGALNGGIPGSTRCDPGLAELSMQGQSLLQANNYVNSPPSPKRIPSAGGQNSNPSSIAGPAVKSTMSGTGARPPMGAVMRCISPTAVSTQPHQVPRGRPPQFASAGRTVPSMSPLGARNMADPLQNSIGSSAGPRPLVGTSSAYSPQTAPSAASTNATASPPPPVIGAGGLLGSRGSSGTPGGTPGAAPRIPVQLSWR